MPDRWLTRLNRRTGDPGYLDDWYHQQCGSCRRWIPLSGRAGLDWGACTQQRSDFDSQIRFEHDGCRHYEDAGDCSSGRQELARLLGAERGNLDPTELGRIYEQFCLANDRFKTLILAWQMADDHTLNDHSDADYDTVVIVGPADLPAAAAPILADAAAQLPRLHRYTQRLADVLANVHAGNPGYISSPLLDSYHPASRRLLTGASPSWSRSGGSQMARTAVRGTGRAGPGRHCAPSARPAGQMRANSSRMLSTVQPPSAAASSI